MEKETRLEFDDDLLLDGAQRRFEEGDYFGALALLNKREFLNAPLADAYEIYADIYEALGVWPMVADSWFRFLDTCAREEFSEGYEGLAVAYMNMGKDVQSGFYYRHALMEDGAELSEEPAEPSPPELRLVHAEGMELSDPELMAEGLSHLRTGELQAARDVFMQVPEESADYPSAAGLAAMCTLMMGEETDAESVCERLVGKYPNNVQILTTYCAVLGAREKREEAKEVARRLYGLPSASTDDLYRIATALCETGLHREALEKLRALRERLPYDENVLWFLAVAAYKTSEEGENAALVEEAIDALETLTAIYPRKAVAVWYLGRLRQLRDGGEPIPMLYYYRLPEEEYRKLAALLLNLSVYADNHPEEVAASEEFAEAFRLAFDEMEGRDEKLQLLAAKVAVKCRADGLLRGILLDCEGDEIVKISVLHDFVCRNEENSFGAVILHLYKEMFTYELDIGKKKRAAFMLAFADVYAKYALLGEDSESKLCAAGEDLYKSLAEAKAWELFDEREALAAALYREARLAGGERSLAEICKLFDADMLVTEHILDYMM